MSKKNLRTFVMCSVLILMVMCGFSLGLTLNAIVGSKLEKQNTFIPQIRIMPKDSGKDKEDLIKNISTKKC